MYILLGAKAKLWQLHLPVGYESLVALFWDFIIFSFSFFFCLFAAFLEVFNSASSLFLLTFSAYSRIFLSSSSCFSICSHLSASILRAFLYMSNSELLAPAQLPVVFETFSTSNLPRFLSSDTSSVAFLPSASSVGLFVAIVMGSYVWDDRERAKVKDKKINLHHWQLCRL